MAQAERDAYVAREKYGLLGLAHDHGGSRDIAVGSPNVNGHVRRAGGVSSDPGGGSPLPLCNARGPRVAPCVDPTSGTLKALSTGG